MLSLLNRQVSNVQNNLSNVIRNICALCLVSSTYGIGVGFKNLKDMQLIIKEPCRLKKSCLHYTYKTSHLKLIKDCGRSLGFALFIFTLL